MTGKGSKQDTIYNSASSFSNITNPNKVKVAIKDCGKKYFAQNIKVQQTVIISNLYCSDKAAGQYDYIYL